MRSVSRHSAAGIAEVVLAQTGNKSIFPKLFTERLHVGIECPIVVAMIQNNTSKRCSTTRNVFGCRHHFDINAMEPAIENNRGRDRTIGNQNEVVLAGNSCQLRNIGNLKLRVGYRFKINGPGIFIHQLLYCFGVGGINKTSFQPIIVQRLIE